jgi:YCII-related domain
MGSYNDELKEAGVLIDLAGLLPSAMGRRVRFSGGNRAVIDGPFSESKQLIAGYWILHVPSMEEAVEWAERFSVPGVVPDLPGRVRRRGRDRDPSGVRAGELGTGQRPLVDAGASSQCPLRMSSLCNGANEYGLLLNC